MAGKFGKIIDKYSHKFFEPGHQVRGPDFTTRFVDHAQKF